MEDEVKTFTVTATATYFVTAHNGTEAKDIIYEAMLGNDYSNLLGWGEIHESTMQVEPGYHSVIVRDI